MKEKHLRSEILIYKNDPKKYWRVHTWMHRKYGSANMCCLPSCEGKSKTFVWGLIKGKKYEQNRENFMMICQKCHHHYDFEEEKDQYRGIGKNGIPSSKNWKKAIKLAQEKNKKKVGIYKNDVLVKSYDSITDLAKDFEKTVACVSHALKGRRRLFVGYVVKYL